MHDLDRTQLETGYEGSEFGGFSELGSETYETGAEAGSVLESAFGEAGEPGFETYESFESPELPLPEMMETQLAAELLEISNEDELDHFLGNLFRKAAMAFGKAIPIPTSASLGRILKSLGKRLLPIAGRAIGTFVGGPAGTALGGQLASAAGPKRGVHRKRRARRPLPGMLLHIDGSQHRWFQDERWHDLIVILDDATSEIYYAQLVEAESTATVLAALRDVVERKGVFCALYSDRGSHFWQ